uniref:Uncharacterized protein n=1 Tax=Romanomermis culicivorax TaxID=13658 RepID=A0A915I640_ROMCU
MDPHVAYGQPQLQQDDWYFLVDEQEVMVHKYLEKGLDNTIMLNALSWRVGKMVWDEVQTISVRINRAENVRNQQGR